MNEPSGSIELVKLLPEQCVFYRLAIRDCLEAHRAHGDMIGENALSTMLSLPSSDHKAFALRRFNYAREVCLNAIDYANQDALA